MLRKTLVKAENMLSDRKVGHSPYLFHEPLRNVRTDESCASTDADFDDSIWSNLFRMGSYEIFSE